MITAGFMFVAVASLSIIPVSSANALSLREITQGLIGNNRNDRSENRPTRQPDQDNRRTEPVVTPPPAPTETVVMPAEPVVAPAVTPSAPVVSAPATPAIISPVQPVDTSAQVAAVASEQTTIAQVKTAPYQSNRLDPVVVRHLIYAGLATAALGLIAYTITFIPSRRTSRHNIPVKFSS